MDLRKIFSKKGTSSVFVNIPKSITEKLKLSSGDYVEVKEDENKIIIEKIK